jgi:hypothetical protein
MQDFTVQALDRMHTTLFEIARDVRALDGRMRSIEARLARLDAQLDEGSSEAPVVMAEVVPAAGRVFEWEVRDMRDG